MAIAVANRYARALADVVVRTGDYRGVLEELQSFLAVYLESAELRDFFETPAVPLPDKMKVLESILKRLEISLIPSSFLRVILGHYRMGQLEEIVLAYLKIANDRMGIVQVKVYSAAGLSEDERRVVRSRFQEVTGKHVELEFHLDEVLLGGVLAQIGSTVYDGSIRGHLDRLRERLIAR